MVDIDERVVEMKFDSSDFEQKSKNTLSILDKLHQKLSFKDVADDDSLNSLVDNVQKVADKAYTIVDRMIDKIKDNIANNLVNFLQENTLGQFKAGFNKYAEMTTSVATLKGQGYAMEKITEQLERLNYFTDETSYKFTDMVREIGKFTASGQSLEDATQAMMGIANWAALSGKNATDASRAMYQLSQALGAGQMRLVDYKSIQNLNMDTVEFRKNAIEAAVAVGTLKDNLNGTWTSTLSNETFSLNEFADKLTKGKWFNSKVMMTVFQQYSEAVDEVREIYEKGRFIGADGMRYEELNTTAEAIKAVKQNNEKLVGKFKNTTLKSDEISKLLKRWKAVENVTGKTVKEYAELHDITEEQAKVLMEEKQKGYTEYLKEYGEIFKNSTVTAAEALKDWHTYVSEFGVKSFMASQEAKTFGEAIESAKDAASTVWTNIYTTIFGDYEEAKEIWTDLANALYEIFVDRLWGIADIFTYWKTGGKSALDEELLDLQDELEQLQEIDLAGKTDAEVKDIKQQIKDLKGEIKDLNDTIENTEFVNGRTRMFQGIYAFGSAFKSIITNFREAWDDTIEDNSAGEKLLTLSEKIRRDGFRFYDMMTNKETGLASTDFFRNIAISIQNILSPLREARNIIKSVIGQFLPNRESFINFAVKISEAIRDVTAKLVPSQKTILNISRILRGIVALIKLLAKAAYGLYITVIKPIVSAVYEILSNIFGGILEVLAEIGDALFNLEEGIGPMEALATVGSVLRDILGAVAYALGTVVRVIITLFGPAIAFVINSVKELIQKLRDLVADNNGNILVTLAKGLSNIASRMKAAWKSTKSFADVFNKFKTGKGLSNVVEMLGEMLDLLMVKIGNTIGAMFGLQEVINTSTVGKAVSTFKDIVIKAFAMIKWSYTNIVRPVLETFIIGVATMIRNLGQSIREGDIGAILTQIKEIFKTFTSIQLFKLFRVISKIFGSGGLLRLINNGAKALKGLYRYFGAKAMNEFSSSIIKVAIALTMLAAGAVALTYLPTDQLEKFNSIMKTFGIMLAAVMVVIFALTLIADKATWGLFGLAAAFLSITAMVFVFMLAAKKLDDFLNNIFGDSLKDKNGNFDGWKLAQGLITIIGPFLAVASILLILLKIVKKVTVGTNPIQFGLGIIGIITGVATIVNSFQTLLDLMHDPKNSMNDIIQALLLLMGMFAMLALVTRVILKVTGESMAFKEGIGSGIAMAITIASLALVVRMILIPTLDTLVENVAKFPVYLQAMAVLAAAMIGMTAALGLMTNYSNNWLHILSAGLVFRLAATTIKNVIIPLFKDLESIKSDVLPTTAALSLLMLSIGMTINMILNGVSQIIMSISKINPKSWIAIIGTTGIIIGGVMVLGTYLEKTEGGLGTDTIIAMLGTTMAIIIAFGTFAGIISKTIGNNTKTSKNVLDIFKAITRLIIVIAAGIILAISAIKILYQNDVKSGLEAVRTFSIMTLITVAGLLASFFAAIKSITTFIATNQLNTSVALKVIQNCFGMAIAMMSIFTTMAIIGLQYKSTDEYIQSLSITMMGTIAAFGLILMTISKLYGEMFWKSLKLDNNDLKMMRTLFAGAVALVASIGLLLIPQLDSIKNVPWQNAVSALAGISLVIVALGHVMTVITKTMLASGLNLKTFAAGIGGFLVTMASVALFAIVIFKQLNTLRGIDPTALFGGLAAMLAPLFVIVELVTMVAKTKFAEKFVVAAAEVAGGIIMISLAVGTLVLAISALMELFNPGSTWLSSLGKSLFAGTKDNIKYAEKTGEAVGEAAENGYKKETHTKSPSRDFIQYGKYIDQGLGIGIDKNRRFAINAATGLGEYVNDSFCDYLQIQSPSKVFYENGRFVVRGFINGMNDESNKNKKAGEDMASGFSEGMDNAMEGMKDKWKGLWSELGMDEDIKNAIAEGTEGTAGSIFDSLFGSAEKLTEEEEKRLEELKKKRDELQPRLSEGPSVQREYQEIVQEINKLESKASSSGNKLSSGITGSIFDSLSSLSTDGGFLSMLGGLGSTISGGVIAGFGGDTGKSFSDNIKDAVGGAFDAIGLTELGEDGAGEYIDGMTGTTGGLGSSGNKSKFATLGESFGGSFVNGMASTITTGAENLFSSLYNVVEDRVHFDYGDGGFWDSALSDIFGEKNFGRNKQNFQNWWDQNAANYGMSLDNEKGFTYYYKVMAAIRKFGNEGELDPEYFEEYIKEFNELGDNFRAITELEIDEGFFGLGEGKGYWRLDEDKVDNEDAIQRLKDDFSVTVKQMMDEYAFSLTDEESARLTLLNKELDRLANEGKYDSKEYRDIKDEIYKLNNSFLSREQDLQPFIDENIDFLFAKAIEYGYVDKSDDGRLTAWNYDKYDKNSPSYKMFADFVKTGIKNNGFRDLQLANLQDSLNNVLSEKGFKEVDFGTDALETIEKWAKDNGYLNEYTSSISKETLRYSNRTEAIINYLRTIVTDGLKISDEESTKSTYTRASEAIEALRAAENSGDTSQIANYSAKRNQMRDEVISEYSRIMAEINSSTFSMLPEAVQKSLKEQAEFYERNWNLGSGTNATNTKLEELRKERDRLASEGINSTNIEKYKEVVSEIADIEAKLNAPIEPNIDMMKKNLKTYEEQKQYYSDLMAAMNISSHSSTEDLEKYADLFSQYIHYMELVDQLKKTLDGMGETNGTTTPTTGGMPKTKETKASLEKRLSDLEADRDKLAATGLKNDIDMQRYQSILNEIGEIEAKIFQDHIKPYYRNIEQSMEHDEGVRITSFDQFTDFMDKTGLKIEGENIIKLFQLGLDEGWIEVDKDGKIKAQQVTYDIIQTIRQALGIKSPSTVGIALMKFFGEGMSIGIDESTDTVLSSLNNMLDLMNKDTLTGINAMANSLDDETIQPTITPVYDDSMMANAGMLNRSFTGVNNAANAAINSFQEDTPNYNGPLALLSSQVTALTGIVNSFMQMVENGDIVTVNVNSEVDTNNLYNLVVNTNRQKFRQTGKNQLLI